ncbi:MAG: hypothetical protein HKN13_09485 [Rhodothermales bacterium]|nr:hypothetical protein [Rhodothermales bacterium]
MDFNIGVTAEGKLLPTNRVFNRLVVSLLETPFELTTFDIGEAPIQICATTDESVYLTTRPGELISSLPCFKRALHPSYSVGNTLDGWELPITDGRSHSVIAKNQSLGSGASRITRFSEIALESESESVIDIIHLTILIDRNQNGRLERDEFSFVDLVLDQPGLARLAHNDPLSMSECRTLLTAEADRIDTALSRISIRYAQRLGDRFSIDQFMGDSTAVIETKGVFALLARDQFQDMFQRVKETPAMFRNAAVHANADRCKSEAEIRETADIAISTFEQLWDATLELATATIRGWRKVYGQLGQ